MKKYILLFVVVLLISYLVFASRTPWGNRRHDKTTEPTGTTVSSVTADSTETRLTSQSGTTASTAPVNTTASTAPVNTTDSSSATETSGTVATSTGGIIVFPRDRF